MGSIDFKEIIKQLESKEQDCVNFSKKYKLRQMEDLYQYYEGAGWAFKFAISLIKDSNKN